MAKKRVSGVFGSLTVANVNADLASYDLDYDQQVDDDTNYGNTTYGSHHGSGVNMVTLSNVNGFMNYGATGTQPFVAMDGEAVACVATIATGCTFTGNFVPTGFGIRHKKVSGAIPFSVKSLLNVDVVTIAWATS